MGKDRRFVMRWSENDSVCRDNIRSVRCLFERSGTFKNAFEKFGIPAVDYDIVKEHEHVQQYDLFDEIGKAFMRQGQSIFDSFHCDDLLLAFFPCTHFSDQAQLKSRGDSFQLKDATLDAKLSISSTEAKNREYFFDILCTLVRVCIYRNLRLVIENPYGKCNFLRQYFPVKPSIIIKDRSHFGDFYKKPTQFFFINCRPNLNLELVCDPAGDLRRVEDEKGFSRSEISPRFAEIFIENWIL